MSATTPQALPPASAVDYVRSLPPEEKQAVFLELLREAMRSYGDMGLLPIDDEEGRPFGYYVPPKAAQILSDQGWNEIPPEVRQVLSRPVCDLDNCVSSEEMLTILSSEADSPRP
jgi:hypothetical protein